jgi:hypothetical protein
MANQKPIACVHGPLYVRPYSGYYVLATEEHLADAGFVPKPGPVTESDRDVFAMAALAGIQARYQHDAEVAARMAYEVADAMIAERSK